LYVTLVIYQESLHDTRSLKYKKSTIFVWSCIFIGGCLGFGILITLLSLMITAHGYWNLIPLPPLIKLNPKWLCLLQKVAGLSCARGV